MNKIFAILLGGLLAANSVQAESLEQQLQGTWRSQCKRASGNYLQITSRFNATGAYEARSRFYTDADCKTPMALEIKSKGLYQLGQSVTTADGDSAREIDIDVKQLHSGGLDLPGRGQVIAQIIAIIDNKLIFGDAPGLQAVTAGERPQKLNKNFYSHKQ